MMSPVTLLKFLKIMPITGPATQSIIGTMRNPSFIVFIGVYVFVLLSFSIAFHLGFGTFIIDLKNYGSTIMAMFRMALGDFDYDSLNDANKIFGPLFFITFMFFMGIIFMNMFIAVLSEIYMSLQEENDKIWEIFITNLMIENNKWTYRLRRFLYKFKLRREANYHLFSHSKAVRIDVIELPTLSDRSTSDLSFSRERSRSTINLVDSIRDTEGASKVDQHSEDEEQMFSLEEDEIFDLTLQLRNERTERTNMQIAKLIEDNNSKMQSQIDEVKSMIEKLQKTLDKKK